MIKFLQNFLISWGQTEILADIIVRTLLCLVLMLAVWLLYLVLKGPVLRVLEHFVVETTRKIEWDDVLLEKHFFHRCVRFMPVLLLYLGIPQILKDTLLAAPARTALAMLLVILGMLILDSLINTAKKLYDKQNLSKKFPLGPFVQVLKIFMYFITLTLLVSMLLNKSPLFLISGLGAITAVLLLVFKDTLLGFIAGIQLIGNRMLGEGDWISMPSYGADGDVKEITLTTVKVGNWDNTITTIPTYALISESFKNWRGMQESGGRRIKRTINLDLSSIKFCDQQMLDQFAKIQYIADYIKQKQEEVDSYNAVNQVNQVSLVNGRRLTNVGTFRAYAEAYLRNHPDIHQSMTFLVRHRQPTEHGLPIELYVFSRDQVWATYESIQADIFDHLLAVIPEFNLRVFQAPSGSDFHQFLSSEPGL